MYILFMHTYFICSNNFMVDFLGVSRYIYIYISSENRDNFLFFFPNYMLFLNFFGLIALSRNSSAIWNRYSGESKHPSLISDLRGRTFSFLLLSIHICFYFFIIIFSFWPQCTAYGIFVPQLGLEPMSLALRVQSPNHWTTRDFPCCF